MTIEEYREIALDEFHQDATEETVNNVLLTVSSEDRFLLFLNELADWLHGDLYWYALRRAYQMSDNLYEFSDDVLRCFTRGDEDRDRLMTNEELQYLNSLPDTITIYRGMTKYEQKKGEFGVSWSLKKGVAKHFADKYVRNFSTNHLDKTVHSITVNKKDVIAYFGEREEYEIIYIQPERIKSLLSSIDE